MARPVVAFYDLHPGDEDAYRLALGSDFELVLSGSGLNSETVSLAREAAVISVHVSSIVSEQVMAALPELKLVACRSTGTDHVDGAYAKAHGIQIQNVPAYGQATVAEYAFMLLLDVSRRLKQTERGLAERDLAGKDLTGSQLAGKTLGIIGTGRIGQHVAAIARGFGMTVLGYDLFPQAEAATTYGFEYRSLDNLLKASDYLTLHAPATPETHHMLGAREFGLMKPGIYVVNTARGSLIDTPALLEALKSGKVAGAGLDVLEGEERPGSHAWELTGYEELQRHPNVVVTPHNAYNSYEALEIIRQTTISNIKAWHKQKSEQTDE